MTQEIGTSERKVDEDLGHGRWQAAVDGIDATIAQRRVLQGNSIDPATLYPNQKAEALIGLGRPQDALDLADSRPNVHNLDPLTEALARAMVGETIPVKGETHARAAYARFSAPGATGAKPPAPASRAQIVACVRLERAVSAWGSAQNAAAEREAREVLRTYPNEPLAAYVLADSLGREKRWKEAEPYWKIAMALPGDPGKQATGIYQNLHPERTDLEPQERSLGERTGPLTPNLLEQQAKDQALIRSLLRK